MEDSTRSNLTRKLVNDCHKRVGKVVLKVKTFIRFQTSQVRNALMKLGEVSNKTKIMFSNL